MPCPPLNVCGITKEEHMRKLFLFISFLIITTNVYGEPSRTFRYLMDEPLTLFEWGLFKLEKYTDQIKFKELDLISNHSNIRYDWDKNRLEIEFIVYPKYKNLSKMPAKEICKKAISHVRESFGTQHKSDTRALLSVSRFFEHTGFTNKTRPKNLMEEVENSAKVQIKVYGNKTDKPPYKNIASCEGSLMGKEILFLENE